MVEKINSAFEVLNNSGVIARDVEEACILEMYRKLPEAVKRQQAARMDGFLEAMKFKAQTALSR
ncbi:MAG: hypothetical protein NC078_11365 [Ruminococcus sp.]|nr:hypothetical protein [Ruminococcus sp.]